MRTALVHDYLIDYGGAERVLSALHEIYPSAPIYVLIYRPNKLGKFADEFKNAKVIQSKFGYLPFADKLISPLRFLLPVIWKSFNLKKFDLIISSASWAVTKGFTKKKGAVEICYLHTPPRYLYGYDTSRNWRNLWFSKLVAVYSAIVNHFMRQYDFNQAQRVDYFIANSKNVAARVNKFYRRGSVVIYPPVNVEKFISSKIKPKVGDYFLTGGRMVASKNFDLVIKAAQKAKVNLKIFGIGPEERRLKKIAGGETEFLDQIPDEELISYYKGAKAFILAGKDEDFGITPIEANACGCPAIAFRGGGFLETVTENKSGIFFDELTVESLSQAIRKFDSSKPKAVIHRRTITKKACIANAKKFSKERFVKEIEQYIMSHAGTTRS